MAHGAQDAPLMTIILAASLRVLPGHNRLRPTNALLLLSLFLRPLFSFHILRCVDVRVLTFFFLPLAQLRPDRKMPRTVLLLLQVVPVADVPLGGVVEASSGTTLAGIALASKNAISQSVWASLNH